jgi:eukaryotic-like serine/threonine-protein kinase
MGRVIKLGRTWTLEQQIGGGGFGTVFKATDDGGKLAAIKLVEVKPGADREALIAAEVSGLPKVVQLIEWGEDGNEYVLVMPLADRSLDKELASENGPMSVDSAVPILTDIAEALVGVHAKDVINRDIKPANVLLIQGEWQVADFGIARYAEATTGIATFKFHGSPPYVAPERWRGERATKQSDVYSFGAVAHELLAGTPPFQGPDFASQHMREAPPSLTGVPPKLASIVIECLDKAPEARPTAANILNRLRSLGSPSSRGAADLQAANQAVATANADASAKLAVARNEQERRKLLVDAGSQRLRQIGATLQELIAESAPQAGVSTARTAATGWSRSLGPATIFMNEINPAELDVWGPYRPAFDVVAYTEIGVRIPRDQYGWEGRIHSLWYCDATESGVYRWHETAFMMMPLVRSEPTVVPFGLPPGPDAGVAVAPVLGHIQVAWPFTPFDQGDEGEFLDRWLGWFGQAALGNLRRPSSMPERPDSHNSWRR